VAEDYNKFTGGPHRAEDRLSARWDSFLFIVSDKLWLWLIHACCFQIYIKDGK
jgi:hypothetical protein